MGAFHAYLCEGKPEGMAIPELRFFHTAYTAPNSDILNQVARKLGAKTANQETAFRKLVFEYPLAGGQKDVDASLQGIAAAGDDKDRRMAAFLVFEQALRVRDGFRPGLRVELGQAICDHPANPGFAPKQITGVMHNIAVEGGETTLPKAELIATYACPGGHRQHCVEALAPSRLPETAPGRGNLFQKGVRQHRPGWSPELCGPKPSAEEVRAIPMIDGYAGPSPSAIAALKTVKRTARGQPEALASLRADLPENCTQSRIAGFFAVEEAEYSLWEKSGKIPEKYIPAAIDLFLIPPALQPMFRANFTLYSHRSGSKSTPDGAEKPFR